MINMPGKKFKVSFKTLFSSLSEIADVRMSATTLFLVGLTLGGALASSSYVKPGRAQQVEQVAISGVILDNRGEPMADVVISVDGYRRASTLTGANGSYSVLVPKDGSYIVTPYSSSVLFAPLSLSFDKVTANLAGVNFTGTRVRTFKVAGRIVDERGNAVSDVVIRVSDSPQILTISGPTGSYTFDHLTAGTGYTLTPSKAGITFAPPFFTIPTLNADFSAINFVAVPHDKVRISGIVTDSSGQPLPDVIVGLNGAQPSLVPTNSSGVFAFIVPAGGNYMIAPARNGYSFNPPSVTLNNVNENVLSANFVGAPAPTLGISGYVVDGNGAPMVDVPVTLTGSANGSSPTGPIGNYSFSVLASGNYTIIPMVPGFVFSPPSRSFTNLSSDQIAVNFVGTPGNPGNVGPVPTASPEGVTYGPSPTPNPEASPSPSPSPEASFSPTPLPKGTPKKTPAPGEEAAPQQTPQNPTAKTGPQDKTAVTNAKSVPNKGRSRRRGNRKRRVGRSRRTVRRPGTGAVKKRQPRSTKKRR